MTDAMVFQDSLFAVIIDVKTETINSHKAYECLLMSSLYLEPVDREGKMGLATIGTYNKVKPFAVCHVVPTIISHSHTRV